MIFLQPVYKMPHASPALRQFADTLDGKIVYSYNTDGAGVSFGADPDVCVFDPDTGTETVVPYGNLDLFITCGGLQNGINYSLGNIDQGDYSQNQISNWTVPQTSVQLIAGEKSGASYCIYSRQPQLNRGTMTGVHGVRTFFESVPDIPLWPASPTQDPLSPTYQPGVDVQNGYVDANLIGGLWTAQPQAFGYNINRETGKIVGVGYYVFSMNGQPASGYLRGMGCPQGVYLDSYGLQYYAPAAFWKTATTPGPIVVTGNIGAAPITDYCANRGAISAFKNSPTFVDDGLADALVSATPINFFTDDWAYKNNFSYPKCFFLNSEQQGGGLVVDPGFTPARQIVKGTNTLLFGQFDLINEQKIPGWLYDAAYGWSAGQLQATLLYVNPCPSIPAVESFMKTAGESPLTPQTAYLGYPVIRADFVQGDYSLAYYSTTYGNAPANQQLLEFRFLHPIPTLKNIQNIPTLIPRIFRDRQQFFVGITGKTPDGSGATFDIPIYSSAAALFNPSCIPFAQQLQLFDTFCCIQHLYRRSDGLIGAVVLDTDFNSWYCIGTFPTITNTHQSTNYSRGFRA